NQKNTWELGLIDHLSKIIHAGEEEDDETNFQKASCTLEAGVKIYSLRVDSVHSEAYKVLGGINRAGRGEEADLGEGGDAEPAQEEGVNKKDVDRRISPASTLEPSFEALNVKKFDAAFTVDPLYHQTTAQFDEGGAKGLLLYNLGVYGSCCVLFDSFEAPDKCILSDPEKAEVIDLSFAKELAAAEPSKLKYSAIACPSLPTS
uniref:Condensin complex subunit 2 n=1 Tax=Aegilops tauschii subsp. strangulata TaxID=200361 RepID=A0A453EWD3_AEGTS